MPYLVLIYDREDDWMKLSEPEQGAVMNEYQKKFLEKRLAETRTRIRSLYTPTFFTRSSAVRVSA